MPSSRIQASLLPVLLCFIACYAILTFLVSQWHIQVEFNDGVLLAWQQSTPVERATYSLFIGEQDAATKATQDTDTKNQQSIFVWPKIHTCRPGNNETIIAIPTAPAFLIVGAQRSGTSSLADLLWEHPDIVGPSEEYAARPFEPHYFDWDFPSEQQRKATMRQLNLSEDELYCRYRQEYARNFDVSLLLDNQHLLSFEKTPSYFFHSHIPRQILQTCPWKPKIVAILRNPIDRAFSHHNAQQQQKLNRTFEELVDREVREMRSIGLSNAPTLSEYVKSKDEVPASRFAIPDMTIQELSSAHKGLYRRVHLLNYLQRSIYWNQLWYWKEAFGSSHLLVLQYERLYTVDRFTAQAEYNRLLRFLNVSEQTLPEDHQQYQRAAYESRMNETTLRYLQQFFRPHNAKLAEMLDDKQQWLEAWDQ